VNRFSLTAVLSVKVCRLAIGSLKIGMVFLPISVLVLPMSVDMGDSAGTATKFGEIEGLCSVVKRVAILLTSPQPRRFAYPMRELDL
jgi:hypothetical protein